MARLFISFLAFMLWLPLAAAADTYLLMAEEEGCMWCERWNEEIGPIYPKTTEGQVAPLQRFDIADGSPDIEMDQSVYFTPTFILVEDGVEVGRIEGYPGEDFFWGLLTMLFEDANIPLDHSG